MNQMSKVELNPTVNESGNSILLKLRISKKHTVVQRPKALAQRPKALAQISQFHGHLNP